MIDARGGAPREPCAHVWQSWHAASGRFIEDCLLCGDRRRAPPTCAAGGALVDEIKLLRSKVDTFLRLAHHDRGDT